MFAINLATDPVVRAFFQDLVKHGGVAQDATDSLMKKPELLLLSTLACAIFTAN